MKQRVTVLVLGIVTVVMVLFGVNGRLSARPLIQENVPLERGGGVIDSQNSLPPEILAQFKNEQESLHPDGRQLSPDGLWYMPADAVPMQGREPSSPQATGGADDFGYTWDDSVALNWIDASGGTETGLNSSVDHTGAINIGFPFKYYENIHSELYISRFGFVAFNDTGIYNSQSEIPSPEPPNDVIAPHWVITDDVNGYVRYLRGGVAPNRWLAVEWNRLASTHDLLDEYTFEVILHENGDVVFQYGTITTSGSRWCESSGVEDSRGLDGLSITDFCNAIAPNHAVHIYRPPASARINVSPLAQGNFVHAGETVTYELTMRNTGELGSDTYDLVATSTWPMALYDTNGTMLTDTNGNSTIDTGSIAQGASKTIIAKVQVPTVIGIGEDNEAMVTATSALNPAKSKTATMQAAVPALFAQVYRDQADSAMSLYLAEPANQVVQKATPDSYYGDNMAVAEMPNASGFVYAWSKFRSLNNNNYVSEIEYVLLDHEGNTTRAITRLTDNSNATVYTYDYPVVAVAPNGNIGVLWQRYLYNGDTGQQNYNIWFATLNASGDVIHAPVNLTNNNAWGGYGTIGVPRFYDQRITATEDNRFMLAWNYHSAENSGDLRDIYYAVRDSNGNIIKPTSKFTNGVAGGNYISNPSLTMLNNNRALLAYYNGGYAVYAVLDSVGNTVLPESSTGNWGFDSNGVQLVNGNILLAWTASGNLIEFVLLDGTTYNVISGPTVLNNPVAATGDGYVSATTDAAGHGILTWMDSDYNSRQHLYYALIDGDGSVLTQPMIFRTAEMPAYGSQNIFSSYEGYGNTSYTINPTSNGVDNYIQSSDLVGAAPGGVASIPVSFGNNGSTTATSVIITATLDISLTYASDTSGIAPVQNGRTLTWDISNLDFLGNGRFSISVNAPNEAIGSRFPVTLEIAATETDANITDNTTDVDVMISNQVFLPIIMR